MLCEACGSWRRFGQSWAVYDTSTNAMLSVILLSFQYFGPGMVKISPNAENWQYLGPRSELPCHRPSHHP